MQTETSVLHDCLTGSLHDSLKQLFSEPFQTQLVLCYSLRKTSTKSRIAREYETEICGTKFQKIGIGVSPLGENKIHL